jgi:diguanylate cyclase (GGDEF)-like protein
VSLISAILIGNVALALLAAALLWRASLNADDLRRALGLSQRLAATDQLTDLPNRLSLHRKLASAIAAPGPDPALLVIDLDGFKVINDTLGHEVGDALLKAVAGRFSDCLHAEDVLARLGSDEFAALITRPDSEFLATETARSISDAMNAPFLFHNDVISVKASIGITAIHERALDATEALRRADIAMYVAKGERQAAYQIYTSDMDESLHLRRTISAELEQALVRNQLRLVYQPLVCARTGRLMSAEALMRWPTKEGRASAPGIFIPIAEETGLISRLGEWALDEAVREIKRQKTLPIAVNVSPVQFRGADFAASVEAIMRRHDVNPNLLRIEITEGVLMSHTEEAQTTMKRLRRMGVQVLLDDFGTGYSSLSYLHKFEFDGLKIDRAFLQHLEEGRTGRQLLKSIIALGHSLNMKVVAEGVETDDQAALLQLLSCDLLQGYALGRPDHAERLYDAERPTENLTARDRRDTWQRGFN